MFEKFKLTFLVLLGFSIAACDGDDDKPKRPDKGTVVSESVFRVSHAVADAPVVDVFVAGNLAIDDLDFAQSSAASVVPSTSYSIRVDAILPGDSLTVIGPVGLEFDADTEYEIVAVGEVGNIEPVVLSRPVEFSASMVRATVLHAALGAPAVDVHVTSPDAELSASTVLGSFEFKESLGPVEIAPGDYRIRVTPKDALDVLYDSGTLALAAGTDAFIAAVANTQTTNADASKAPISLAIGLNDDAAILVPSVNNGADLRVVHNAADTLPVDIIANDNFEAPLVSDLEFPMAAGYLNVPADTYNVKVVLADTNAAAIDADLVLENNAVYSVLAVNSLDADGMVSGVEPLVLVDNPRAIATAAQIRVIHGSTVAGDVDVYVTAPDTMLDDSVAPAIADFNYKEDSGYVSLAAGTYDVAVTMKDDKTPVLGPIEVTLEAGKIYTIIARDEAGLTGVDLTLLDAFAEM